jgi:Ca-activated chloride channel homolog
MSSLRTLLGLPRLLLVPLAVLALIIISRAPPDNPRRPTETPNPCIQISILYAPKIERYLGSAIDQFNADYARGIDPTTGDALPAGTKCMDVSGEKGNSGEVRDAIVWAIQDPKNINGKKPTVFMPAVSHWLSLVNLDTGQPVFDLVNSPATTNDPVVIAIWESKLKALQQAYPGQDLGWKELLDLIKNPKGWAAYGVSGRSAVYYGHTDPYISSSGLSTFITEFYVSTWYNINKPVRRLTLTEVNNKDVQNGVSEMHAAIKHYAITANVFKEYLACGGPDYVDFVAMAEDEFLQIATAPNKEVPCTPKEKLVALYPKEGTFFHEHPFAILNAPWVSAEQRAAAEKFRDFVLTEKMQQLVLPGGFRPANPNVPLGYPIVTTLGVDPTQPRTVLAVPDPDVIRAIQQKWGPVKKRADVWLVIDISSSMSSEDKIGKAREAALAFLDAIEQHNRVGLIVFSDEVKVLAPLAVVESNKAQLQQQISSLSAFGGTALYDALQEGIKQLPPGEERRIPVIVLLSDGDDTVSKNVKLVDITSQLANSHSSDADPILVFPIAYGRDAKMVILNPLAQASRTSVASSDPTGPTGILKVLKDIASYF